MDPLDRFTRAAAAHGDRTAVAMGKTVTSYAQLYARALGMASLFCEFREPKVLICAAPGPGAYAAMLGAGLAGGYYIPLNVEAPAAKLCAVAQMVAPDVIVCAEGLASQLLAAAPTAMVVDPEDSRSATLAERPRHRLAYVIFTSGSTGAPKGVVVSRLALTHFVDWVESAFDPTPDDVWAQYSNLGFDISATDIYGALCFGGRVHPVVSTTDRLFPARMVSREGVTIWNSVPSAVFLMMKSRDLTSRNLASLRLMNFCGEPLLPEHLKAIFAARPDLVVQNTYGPTEATVSVTQAKMSAQDYQSFCTQSVALGHAIPNMTLHIVGGREADEGEIVILGPQLAEGYWNDPAKTAEVFRTVELDGAVHRGYYTGDWVQRIDDQIYFKHRKDSQVKIRGFRIELDEVEAAIRNAGWPVAVAMKLGEDLVAVVESQAGAALHAVDVMSRLSLALERYALPSRIYEIPAMPLTENGKIDRRGAADWARRALEASVIETRPPLSADTPP